MVDTPVASIRKFCKSDNDVSFYEVGGCIINRPSGAKARFLEMGGVHFLKLKVKLAPPGCCSGQRISRLWIEFVSEADIYHGDLPGAACKTLGKYDNCLDDYSIVSSGYNGRHDPPGCYNMDWMDAETKSLQAQKLAVMGQKLLGSNSVAQQWLQQFASDCNYSSIISVSDKPLPLDDPMIPLAGSVSNKPLPNENLVDGIDNDDDDDALSVELWHPHSRLTPSADFSDDYDDDAPLRKLLTTSCDDLINFSDDVGEVIM